MAWQMRKMCEGCQLKQANFGLPSDRQRRWCGGCGKTRGAVNLTKKPAAKKPAAKKPAAKKPAAKKPAAKKPAPPLATPAAAEAYYCVEAILAMREAGTQLLVRWVGYVETTWEDRSALTSESSPGELALIAAFDRQHRAAAAAPAAAPATPAAPAGSAAAVLTACCMGAESEAFVWLQSPALQSTIARLHATAAARKRKLLAAAAIEPSGRPWWRPRAAAAASELPEPGNSEAAVKLLCSWQPPTPTDPWVVV
jgi:hypothetical protein